MGVWVYFERKEGQCGAEKIVGIWLGGLSIKKSRLGWLGYVPYMKMMLIGSNIVEEWRYTEFDGSDSKQDMVRWC